MKKRIAFTAGMIAAMVAIGSAASMAHAAQAGDQTENETRERNLADEFPLEAVRQHALAVSEGMDVPDDRLYGIITYGGEDHLMVADEHKEEGHYGAEYIHTYIDTDGIDGYEPEPVNIFFNCPVCGYYSSTIIWPNDISNGRVYWCRCDHPWILGLTIKEDLVR